jgi:hypothetical protein
MRLSESAHPLADVGVQVVPDQDDRGVQHLVRGGDQVRVVGFGQAAALALAAMMDDQPVHQPTPSTGAQADQPGDRDPARPLARHRDHGSVTAAGPGAGLGRTQILPRLVLKDDPRIGRRR